MSVLRDLSQSECRTRLADHSVGRVAVVAPDGPHIIPVNYAIVDETIIFRTSPFTVLATHGREAQVAFEVDGIDPVARAGWSVLVRGRTRPILDSEEIAHIRRIWEPTPWAEGIRTLYLSLTMTDVSGRRVGDLEQVPALLR